MIPTFIFYCVKQLNVRSAGFNVESACLYKTVSKSSILQYRSNIKLIMASEIMKSEQAKHIVSKSYNDSLHLQCYISIFLSIYLCLHSGISAQLSFHLNYHAVSSTVKKMQVQFPSRLNQGGVTLPDIVLNGPARMFLWVSKRKGWLLKVNHFPISLCH